MSNHPTLGKTQEKMSKIKLEVGKTYRNRKGDKVRIVEKDDAPFGPYPYRSEDGYSYQENGRFWHTEWPDDLIEEAPENNGIDVVTQQPYDAAERCRIMGFLQGYANHVTWSHEQLCWMIEAYINHKEYKK